MYKMEDLRKKTEKELLLLISELKGKLLALRFENSTGQLNEVHLMKNTKKDVAKIFTVLKEKRDGKVVVSKTTNNAKTVSSPSKNKVEEPKKDSSIEKKEESNTTNNTKTEEKITTTEEKPKGETS